MDNLIFSIAATLGAEVFSTKGEPLAVLFDVIGNKDSGKITYFILCPHSQSGSDEAAEYYAVHQSYFYFSSDGLLTFSPKLGNQEYAFFLDLPEKYDECDIRDLAEFNRFQATHSVIAGHRSDND